MNQENKEVIKYIARKRKLYCQAMTYLNGYDGADYSPVAEVERDMKREADESLVSMKYYKLVEIINDVLPANLRQAIMDEISKVS